jgi:hypothetical protein
VKPLLSILAVAAIALVMTACGGSSKPAYCSSVSDFKKDVSALGQVNVGANGLSSLTAAVQKVQTQGQKVVSDAKSNFPSETNALGTAISALGTTAKQLTDPQTRKAALIQLPGQIAGVNTAYSGLQNAVKSKCD